MYFLFHGENNTTDDEDNFLLDIRAKRNKLNSTSSAAGQCFARVYDGFLFILTILFVHSPPRLCTRKFYPFH